MTGGMYNNLNDKYDNLFDVNPVKHGKPEIVFITKEVEPPFPEEYEPFNVYFKFENRGSVDAGEFKIRMITECREEGSLGVDIEDQVVPSLRQGATGEAILKFGYGMPAGKYDINAYLDFYNQIHEENEDMNNRHTSFVVIVG